jgi:hypothetical protein
VGAVGVPVKVGLLLSDLENTAEAMELNSVSSSVPLIILLGFPVARVSFVAKLVAFT